MDDIHETKSCWYLTRQSIKVKNGILNYPTEKNNLEVKEMQRKGIWVFRYASIIGMLRDK